MSAPAERVRELVLASAGSGKTFRISSRIIQILASEGDPASVFASTFTRKAAGEILERVLVRLAVAASSAEEAAELATHVTLPAGADPDPAFWQGVLGRTVRALHELDVGTLDSFFGRAVRAFAHDLGLPSGWGIADVPTQARLRAEALEAVHAGADPGVVVELLRGLRGGDVRRSVHDSLLREVDALVRVHCDRASDGPGWDAADELAEVLESEELARRAEELAEALEQVELPKTKKGTPHSGWQRAADSLGADLIEGSWSDVVGNGLVKGILGGAPSYYGKAIEGPVLGLLGQAAELARCGLAGEVRRRAAAMARLAADYSAAFDDEARRAGALRFEDVTRLLVGGGETGAPGPLAERPDLFYRMDGRTRHILLDEFQDTSLEQWRAIRPLTDGLLGEGAPEEATASVVADPKQSIYGWRGAAPVVVESLAERYGLERATLARSWRSSGEVLDAVNAAFRELEENPVFEDDSRRSFEVERQAARSWARAFERHAPVHRDRPGHVVLRAGPPPQDQKDLQPPLLRWAADRVAELHRRHPGRSIGVLVRRNDAVARLIFELRERGVPASEEGGTRLADSPAVVTVLALLRLADHPGDSLARYHVARSPLGPLVGLAAEDDDGAAHRLSQRLRERLLRDGYGPTLADLRDHLRPVGDARDRRRLGQLAELGYRYDARRSLRVDDFVVLALEERVESPGEDAVRVMTVHGSKGLEFDVVVLPELNASLVGGRAQRPPLVFRPDGTGPATHVFPYLNRALRALFFPASEALRGAWTQTRSAEVRDALSFLYVAMTRARHALHMFVPADDGKPGTARTAARLLRTALSTADPGQSVPEGAVLYEAGDPDWSDDLPAPDGALAEASSPAGPTSAIDLRDAPRRRLLPRRKPSDHGPAGVGAGGSAAAGAADEEAERSGGVTGVGESSEAGSAGGSPGDVGRPHRAHSTEAGGMDLRALLGLVDAGTEAVDPRIRGTVVHAWMEEVGWIEDGLPDADTRRRILGREAPELDGDRRRDFLREWGGIVEEAAEREEVRTALSRARAGEIHPGAELVVERELPFLLREENALVEGIIDRLVLVHRGGRVVAAEVVDYKTDRIAPGDDEALRESVALYAPQLRAYRRAVAHLYRIQPDAVRLRLVYLVPGVVRDVDGA